MDRLTFEGNFCDISLCLVAKCTGICSQKEVWEKLKAYEDAEEQGRLLELPCKNGDTAWMVRRFNGGKRLAWGSISDMYFSNDMELCAVVYHVGRGVIGKTVFLTEDAARKALERKG